MITDPIPFMANIALIAHADGKLSPSELGQLEAIRADFKFKKGDFNKAISLVEKEQHKLTNVGTFADQVKNLELMLRVAYADDDLDDSETELVTSFCEKIGITQEQLDRVCDEVINTLKSQDQLCPACGASSEANAKFCSKCGAPLSAEEEAVKLEFEIPLSGISIEFADSTATSFHKALQIAKAADSYETCQKSKKTWHLAHYDSGSISEALPLAEALSGIRNRAVHQNGVEVPWDEIFGFAWCASRRSSAYNPIEYCFGKDENRINPWGCKQARLDWTQWADWFSYGSWQKAGMLGGKVVWVFDKARIMHEVRTNLHQYRFCPHIIQGLPEAVVKHLPDSITVEKNADWEFDKNYEQTPGSIKVTIKEKSDGFTYSDDFWSDGVRPVGLDALRKIMSAALSEIGVGAVNSTALLT